VSHLSGLSVEKRVEEDDWLIVIVKTFDNEMRQIFVLVSEKP
jgi:hypothetical protein